MTFPSLRLVLCASFALALSGARPSTAQSAGELSPFAPPTPARAMEIASALPDAPSYSSSQQPQQPPPGQVQTPQNPQPPPNETPEQRKIREKQESDRQVKEELDQRIGGIIPNFNVRMGGPFVPLSPAQKFDLSFHTIIDPYTFGLAFLFGGGLGELEDSHTGYGHGPAGFFKRVGASYADNVDGNIIGNAILPTVLHQDPRYFRKGTGSIKSRVFYSAMSTFLCKGDNGNKQFNISNVAGNFISGAISNAYYPQDERGVGLTIDNGVFVTLEGMLGAQLLEFSPDVTNKVRKHRDRIRLQKQQQIDAAAAAKMANPPATTTPSATPPKQ